MAVLWSALAFAPAKTLKAASVFTLYSGNAPGSGVAAQVGQTTGWGVEITTSTYYLLVTSVQSTYLQYPGGLSSHPSTPLEDYLSYYFANNSTTVSPGNPFQQDFLEGIPGVTGMGVGAFHIRPDAVASTETANILINYVLFDADPYVGAANQVDEDGNLSSAEIVAVLGSSVQANAATVPEPGTALLGTLGFVGILAALRRRSRQ